MEAERKVAGPTSGQSVRTQALEACLAYHKERVQTCLQEHRHGVWGAEGHERCVKWVELALAEETVGLWVTRELHVGYYLNEPLAAQELLGIVERGASEYHAAVLSEQQRQVYVVTTDGQELSEREQRVLAERRAVA